MEGTLGSDIGGTDGLARVVEEELLDLRGAHGQLTVHKFSHYQALRRVCGGSDLLDAFLMFEREMRRYTEHGGREEAAAAISITAPADSALDRFEHVVGALPQDGRIRDQRTGRRWSDAGIHTIAGELTYLAEVQGRLGTELLTIEVNGTLADGLLVAIYQLTTKNLNERAPLVRLWRYTDSEEGIEEVTGDLVLDLEDIPSSAAGNEQHTLKRHTLHLELPADLLSVPVSAGDPVYSISIEGRDAPMRTVTFDDESDLGESLRLRFTSYRTIASLEIVRI
ncbi:hypothetical protein [Humibacter ginsengiterrae]